jgi:hypothetical protein
MFIGLERFNSQKTQQKCGFPRFQPARFGGNSRQVPMPKGLSGFVSGCSPKIPVFQLSKSFKTGSRVKTGADGTTGFQKNQETKFVMSNFY